MKNKKVEIFKKVIKIFTKREKIKQIIVTEDRRLKNILAYATRIKIKKEHYWKIAYNSDIVEKSPIWRVIHIALHEFGHIVTDADTAIEREQNAEVYALKNIKKYYTSYYKKCCEVDLKYVIGQEVKYGLAFKQALKIMKYR